MLENQNAESIATTSVPDNNEKNDVELDIPKDNDTAFSNLKCNEFKSY